MGILDFASGLAGMVGGYKGLQNAKNLPQYSGYNPQNSSAADMDWGAAMQAIQAATDRNTGMVNPQILESYSALMGIDLSGLVTAGQQAGQQFGALAGAGQQYGDAMGGAGLEAIGHGQDIWARAQDPMNAQHDFERNKTLENVRGAESARGIAMGGVGAGLETDALRNFDIDWKNFQDQRMLNAGTAVTQGNFGAQQDFGASMNIGSQVPGYTMASAQSPIAAQRAVAGAPMDYADMFTNAQQNNVINPYMMLQQQEMPYLGMSGQIGAGISAFNENRANLHNQMQQQSYYGLFGGGQSGTNFMGGNQSGFGNPTNWFGIGGGGGSGGPMSGMGYGMGVP